MNPRIMAVLLGISITYTFIVGFYPERKPDWVPIESFRGLKTGVSTFYDAIRILGRPTASTSGNKHQVHFTHDMYFHYRDLGIKLYGKTNGGYGVRGLKYTRVARILRKE